MRDPRLRAGLVYTQRERARGESTVSILERQRAAISLNADVPIEEMG
jgi:hypothetical protein